MRRTSHLLSLFALAASAGLTIPPRRPEEDTGPTVPPEPEPDPNATVPTDPAAPVFLADRTTGDTYVFRPERRPSMDLLGGMMDGFLGGQTYQAAAPISVKVRRSDFNSTSPAPLPAWDEPRPQRPRPGAERKSRGIEALPHKKQARKAERAARRKSRGRR